MHHLIPPLGLLLVVPCLSCPPSTSSSNGTSASQDAAPETNHDAGVLDAALAADAAGPDATKDVDAGAPDAGQTVDAGCWDGPCPTATNLMVDMNGVTRPLSRTQMGLEHGDAGGYALYMEAYHGGNVACPDQHSPTPDRTLIISGVPLSPLGTRITQADGVNVVFLDWVGDVLPTPAPAHAVDVELMLLQVSVTPEATASASGRLRAFFDGGTVSGVFAATHCTSLDD